MYVIVGGAGEVGFHVARALRGEGHDVTVIEKSEARIERLQDLDVLAIHGNLASRKLLEEEANVGDADLLIACTGSDEVNMVAAALAKTYGLRTICRINSEEYLNVPYSREYEHMGIDVAVCPEMVAAIRIKRLLKQPELLNRDVFFQGKISVAEGRVTPDAFVVGKRVRDVLPPSGLVLLAIYRGDAVEFPRGDTRFHANDRLLMAFTDDEVLGDIHANIGRTKELNAGRDALIKRIMIYGATRVGVHLARLLARAKNDVVLVDDDADRCRWAGEQLPKVLVVQGDATDRDLLIQENVDTFDAFIAAGKEEEYNILAALMAKKEGVNVTVALIHQPELKTFLEDLDIDLAVAPRLSTVGAIIKHVHPATEEMELQHVGEERIIALRLKEGAPADGKRIRDVRIPRDSIIAAVIRGEEVMLPRSDEKFQPGDQVLAFCLTEAQAKLERLFG